MRNKLLKNVIFGLGGQLIVLIMGIIIPRIMLINYGSDVNGLISTVTQIFAYMALLEAGIGQAARNALYKPITENDKKGISYIASAAQQYFRKITVYYGIGVLILAVLVPFVLKSEVDKLTICFVILFQGLSGVISFYFIQTQTVILGADGRGYINNGINVLNQILSYAARIFLASIGVSIVLLQIAYFLITIGKIVIYRIYFDKQYKWINYSAAPRTAKLKDRTSYIISELAWTLFSSTDMIVLSIFVSTQLSSVYSVYNLVFTSLNVLLNAVYSSVNYVLGQTFHESKEKYVMVHDAFNSIFLGGMTILMCIAYILVIPFIHLYTKGITDVNYVYTSLPVMFCLVQIFSWSRYITGNLTAIAGYAKQTSRVSIIEAIMNVVLSICLVQGLGIVGVVIATVVSLPLKVIYCTYICDKKILKRSYKKSIYILGVNYLFFASVVLGNRFINLEIYSYLDFLKYGIFISIVCLIVGVGLNLLANSECIKVMKSLKHKQE